MTRSTKKEVCCPIHPETLMICPRCLASEGGKATARKHGSLQMAAWGRSGGRPRKKKRKSSRSGKGSS